VAESIEFQLLRFNSRRNLRGAPAAEVSVNGVRMWMTRKDIRENIKLFGEHKELWKALEAYDSGADYSLT
jgi:hypothetical protein